MKTELKTASVHAFMIFLFAALPAGAMDTPVPEAMEAKDPAMALVFRHYNEALRLDPKHRAAHEYVGEVYLMSGNVSKAKEHLVQLDKLCIFGCDELSKLKKEVAAYEQQHARK